MTATPTLRHVRDLQIEWGQCDPAGIVFHPRYLEIFDACAALLFQHASGMTKAEMLRRYDAVGIPVVEAGAKFTRPCRYGDAVRIVSWVTSFRRSSFDLRHEVFKRDEGGGDTLAVEGWSTRVWTGHAPGEPGRLVSAPLPAELVARFNEAAAC
jgi:4-hydroxybenzoyl-CoA thioesterase